MHKEELLKVLSELPLKDSEENVTGKYLFISEPCTKTLAFRGESATPKEKGDKAYLNCSIISLPFQFSYSIVFDILNAGYSTYAHALYVFFPDDYELISASSGAPCTGRNCILHYDAKFIQKSDSDTIPRFGARSLSLNYPPN